MHVVPFLQASTHHPQSALNAVRTLCVPVDNTVRMYELVGTQLKELIRLPVFPGDAQQIVMDAQRPALVVKDASKEEVCLINADGEKWCDWRLLPLIHINNELLIYSMCMPTQNMLFVYDDISHSVIQYELA